MTKEIPQPYVLTQDTETALKIIINFNNGSKPLESIDNNIEVKPFFETDINAQLNSKVNQKLNANQNTVCLCLDRFLLSETEKQFSDRFLRISINRSVNGNKTSRQCNQSLEQQFQAAAEFIGKQNTVIVDDGIFTGGTVKFVIDSLKNNGINSNQITQIIGFVGDNQTSQVDGIPVDIIAGINNLFEWIDIRDFSLIGGKQLAASRKNNVTLAIPYLYPWSDGSGASFNRLGSFFEISRKMIQSFSRLIIKYQSIFNQPLTIKNLLKAGFPIPTNQQKTIPITINTNVTEYLNNCLKLIEKEQQRQVIIFDMDGTLYQLDGLNNGFSGSKLETKVLSNATNFILNKENCSIIAAQQILQEGLNNPIGISQYLSERYTISREDYFNIVWNISPKEIIQNFQKAVEVVATIAKGDKKLILVTSAPKVWQQQVLNYLGLTEIFESVYTGEDFKQKPEIFSMLAERYLPTNILSVGDQLKTDIQPAVELGFQTFLVANPNDLEKLI